MEQRLYVVKYEASYFVVTGWFESERGGPLHTEIYAITGTGIIKICSFSDMITALSSRPVALSGRASGARLRGGANLLLARGGSRALGGTPVKFDVYGRFELEVAREGSSGSYRWSLSGYGQTSS